MGNTANAEAERPFYRAHVFCCTNVRPEGHPRGCCTAAGAEKLRNYMKVRAKELGLGETRINSAGCLDRCELGPVMVIYPEGTWYTYRTTDDVDEILRTHLVEGGRVERLLLHPDQREPAA
ncbi:MAG TPA: (2Fe-2S) ferredoxin domain-containing protein [Stellaceae bacterium]|nr:(2Fe-2S) ferredoxin domain-containing protein [Stellaceae bacterium]